MKYCSSCGSEVQEGLSFCTNCGSPINNENTKVEETQENIEMNSQTESNSENYNDNQPNNKNMGGRPILKNTNIGLAILLLFVTCGIYGIVWLINMVNDVNTICADEKSNQSGGVVFLLTLVTCGIYGLIWFYQAGKRMAEAGKKYGVEISDNSVIYLVLALFGLSIVDYCLLQSDLNKFSA